MDISLVDNAVEEIRSLLQLDGADLHLVEADPRRARIQVRLVLTGASCQDCVLPPAALQENIDAALRRRLPTEFELVVDDPRR